MAGRERARIHSSVHGLIAALAIGALLVFAPAAGAAVPFKDISSSGPLNNVYIGNELSCQVRHTGDSQLELFPPATVPGDCGTFLAVGGELFAPDFNAHDGTATGSLGSYTSFTPVSQSEVSGSGTNADPFRVTTVVDAGATGLRITEVNSYVVGRESYRTDTTVTNTGAAAQDAILYHAGDCYLQESDGGYGFVQTEGDRSSPGCSANANNNPPGRIEQFVAISGGANYYEADYSEVWSAIGAQAPFPNTCRCEEFIDNGAGLSWNISIPAGGEVTRSRSTTFSPTGQTNPFNELSANDLIFTCDTRKIAIQFLERKGKFARVEGLAASPLIGQEVLLTTKEKGKNRSSAAPARTVVEGDVSFEGKVRLPKGEAAVRDVQVAAEAADEHSRNVKLTRRARIIEADSQGGRTTLEGKVLSAKVKDPPKLTVRRRVACKGQNQWLKVATGRLERNGSFEVSFDNPQGTVGSIFDVKTKYAEKGEPKAKHSTATWAVALDLG